MRDATATHSSSPRGTATQGRPYLTLPCLRRPAATQKGTRTERHTRGKAHARQGLSGHQSPSCGGPARTSAPSCLGVRVCIAQQQPSRVPVPAQPARDLSPETSHRSCGRRHPALGARWSGALLTWGTGPRTRGPAAGPGPGSPGAGTRSPSGTAGICAPRRTARRCWGSCLRSSGPRERESCESRVQAASARWCLHLVGAL